MAVTRKQVITAVAALMLLAAGIALALGALLHANANADAAARAHSLSVAGDAPAAVEAGVRDSLEVFQDGYVQRDPKNLDSFMSRLFEKDGDVLVMGTDRTDWARGYPATAEFIRGDWANWGDFRINADDAAIWSSQDVAWVASTGMVRFSKGQRPVRLTAILVRNGEQWKFRQLQFQWDDSDNDGINIPRPRRLLKLLHEALGRAAGQAGLIRP